MNRSIPVRERPAKGSILDSFAMSPQSPKTGQVIWPVFGWVFCPKSSLCHSLTRKRFSQLLAGASWMGEYGHLTIVEAVLLFSLSGNGHVYRWKQKFQEWMDEYDWTVVTDMPKHHKTRGYVLHRSIRSIRLDKPLHGNGVLRIPIIWIGIGFAGILLADRSSVKGFAWILHMIHQCSSCGFSKAMFMCVYLYIHTYMYILYIYTYVMYIIYIHRFWMGCSALPRWSKHQRLGGFLTSIFAIPSL